MILNHLRSGKRYGNKTRKLNNKSNKKVQRGTKTIKEEATKVLHRTILQEKRSGTKEKMLSFFKVNTNKS